MIKAAAAALRWTANLLDPQPKPLPYMTNGAVNNGVWLCRGCGTWVLAGRHTCPQTVGLQ